LLLPYHLSHSHNPNNTGLRPFLRVYTLLK
jgi:hypothetical protein